MRPAYLVLAGISLLPHESSAQLTTNGNQLWQQGLAGLADTPENDDNFGFALAAGDFDGDGYTDAAIGAPGEDSSRGIVHVLFGAPEGLTVIDSQAWKPGAESFPGNWESGDRSGWLRGPPASLFSEFPTHIEKPLNNRGDARGVSQPDIGARASSRKRSREPQGRVRCTPLPPTQSPARTA